MHFRPYCSILHFFPVWKFHILFCLFHLLFAFCQNVFSFDAFSVLSSFQSSGGVKKRRTVFFLVPPIFPYNVHVLNECSAAPAELFIFQTPRLVFKLNPFGNPRYPFTAERSPIFTPHIRCGLWCNADYPLLCNHKCTLTATTSWVDGAIW